MKQLFPKLSNILQYSTVPAPLIYTRTHRHTFVGKLTTNKQLSTKSHVKNRMSTQTLVELEIKNSSN